MKEVPVYFVQKQFNHKRAQTFRYRFRIHGEDYSLKDLTSEKMGFKFRYSSNMTVEDIIKVETDWKFKLSKGGHTFTTRPVGEL